MTRFRREARIDRLLGGDTGCNVVSGGAEARSCDPTLPTCAAQQFGSCLGYTGGAAGMVAEAAADPLLT
jgi:hypothetical protein